MRSVPLPAITRDEDQTLTALSLPVGKLFIVGVVGLLLIQLWIVLISTTGSVVLGIDQATAGVIGQATGPLPAGLSIAALFLSLTDQNISYFSIDTPTMGELKLILIGIGALLGSMILISIVASVVGVNTGSHSTVSHFRSGKGSEMVLLAMVLLSVVCVAPGEEMIYRGVIQTELYTHFTRVGSVLVASTLFAIIHIPTYTLPALIGEQAISASLVSIVVVFSMSIILGYGYSRTENLLVPIVMHGIYNALIFSQIYITVFA